jgi:2-oxo-4-hydroxy-4-carboxy-5-ureidoimidazoline decarboxylase
MEGLKGLNALPKAQALGEFLRCCGSMAWAQAMAKSLPFPDQAQLFKAADRIWTSLSPNDWLEAFRCHPKIGDKETLRKNFTQAWALGEQSGVSTAPNEVLNQLADGNQKYETKFGFIFIMCATGKSAQEMLSSLKSRLGNGPQHELAFAAAQQAKITRLRLEKLLQEKKP